MTQSSIPELADDDLDVLLEALEAWESKDALGDVMGDIFDSMLGGRDPSAQAEIARRRKQERSDRAVAKRMRQERSILLRAKIITIRDRRNSERMTQEALHDTR